MLEDRNLDTYNEEHGEDEGEPELNEREAKMLERIKMLENVVRRLSKILRDHMTEVGDEECYDPSCPLCGSLMEADDILKG